MKRKIFIFAGLLLASFLISGAELKIAENGVAHAGILIPENAKPLVKLAAQELAEYLNRITGAEFKFGTTSKHKINFKLGFGNPAGLDKEEFIIRTVGNDIEIFGHDTEKKTSWLQYYYYIEEKGTLQGVYYFLELLGVRWPSPALDHVPEQKNLTLKPLDIRFKPYFKDRHIGSAAYDFLRFKPDTREYCKKNEDVMKWYFRIGESPRHVVPGCHSEQFLCIYKDPEWLADPTRQLMGKNGKRNPRYSCWTHPDVLKMWKTAADGYFSGKTAAEAGFKYANKSGRGGWPYPFVVADEFMIDPMDNDGVNDGRCYCERCQEFRKKHPGPDDTELIWNVIAEVAEFIHEKHPGNFISTLVYPPKRQIPNRKLPPNIRVRICQGGPKMYLAPEAFKADIQKIRDWQKITGNKVPIWAYHCVGHNNSMPHIVETYPHLIKKYILAIKESSEGVYMETHSLTFTRDLLDTYIFHRLMRNPDLDVDKELDEYFRIAYGPAHAEAKLFFAALERLFCEFWHKTVPTTRKPGAVTPWKYRDLKMQKKLWELAYTEKELAALGKLVKTMENKSRGTRYAKPVQMLRKYIYDGMVKQRKIVMGKEEIRKKQNIIVPKTASEKFPSENEWKNVPVYRQIPAILFKDRLGANGSFQMLSNGKTLFVRVEMEEPFMSKTLIKPGQQTGSKDIWKDNCVELYLASMKDNIIWQLIINDRGHWNSRRINQGFSDWIQFPDCEISVKQEPSKWTVQISISLKTLNPKGGELRFNLVRERRIQEEVEYATWSPLAMYGIWHDPRNYGTVRFSK